MTTLASAEQAAAQQVVRLRPLTLVEDGDAVVVGDPASGTYVSIPAVGAAIIRVLQTGASVGQAALAATELAGEPVDAESFVGALREPGAGVGRSAGRAGSWFRWVYLAGQPVALGYFLVFFLPVPIGMVRWTGHGLASGPGNTEFWLVLTSSVLAYASIVLVIVIAAQQAVARISNRRPRTS